VLHAIDHRVCRWILQTGDRADENVFPLTQEFLAEILAVRRTSVTTAAQKLQDAGIIRYSRGKVEITDRAALEQRTCECYASIRDRSESFLNN
jgi:Mn-dependent DtxR family transcriptional regulator